MKQCRMCSQRLTRPGRLCRECEHELDRARHAGVAIGELAPELPSLDASRIADIGGLRLPRSPGTLIAAAFAIGLVSAIGLHAFDASSRVVVATDSVMLDARPMPRQVSLGDAPIATQAAEAREANPVPVARPAPAAPTIAPHAPAAPTIALHAPATSEASVPPDPLRALDDALSRCGEEAFFARPACEERARARYCTAGAGQSPRCAASTRDYGQ